VRRCFLAVTFVLAGLLSAFAQSSPAVVGILPVYDASSAPFGETMAPTLTMALYRTISRVTPRTILLNPGGLYTPGELDDVLEYARASGATTVVVGTLKTPEREGKDSHLVAEAYVVDLSSRRRSRVTTARTRVKQSDIEKKLRSSAGVSPWFTEAMAMSEGAKSSQPISRAADDLARSLHDQLKIEVSAIAGPELDKNRPDLPPKATCDLTFRVFLTKQKTRAGNYTVFLNGRDETTGIVEGVLKTTAPSGVLMTSVFIKDPPTSLSVQPRYLADTILDCSRPVRELTLEIGSEGDGRLVWK
jgi:hypothetical protein